MTTKQTPALQKAWEKYKKLKAEGNKLYVEGSNLYVEGDRLHAEGEKLHAVGDRLKAEGYNLVWKGTTYWRKASRLWRKAVKDVYGNMAYEWRNWLPKLQLYECHLANGEVYGALGKED